jgi:hypothetical protein
MLLQLQQPLLQLLLLLRILVYRNQSDANREAKQMNQNKNNQYIILFICSVTI